MPARSGLTARLVVMRSRVRGLARRGRRTHCAARPAPSRENDSCWRDAKRRISESVMIGSGTSWSSASCTVQRPSPESSTKPLDRLQPRIALERALRQLEQPRAHDGAAVPERRRLAADRGRTSSRPAARSPRRRPPSCRTRCRCGPSSRSGRRRSGRRAHSRPRGASVFSAGSMCANALVGAADHQAEAFLQPPDAAAGAGVEVLDALRASCLGARRIESW